jgi:NADP-dependent 3-hydroxy acid dehydrogenase YdfG
METPLAVVTGASSGTGRAALLAFARAGHPVLGISRHMTVPDELAEYHASYASLDVADYDALASAVGSAEAEFGPVGCLVNSAGTADARAFSDVEPGDYRREIDSGLLGVLNGMKAVLGGMTGRGTGTIINVSSLPDRRPGPAAVACTAAKYGVRAASECLREAAAARGVRVVNIAPGNPGPDFLSAGELAGVILWCYQLPPHICVRELAVAPTRSSF